MGYVKRQIIEMKELKESVLDKSLPHRPQTKKGNISEEYKYCYFLTFAVGLLLGANVVGFGVGVATGGCVVNEKWGVWRNKDL